MPNTSPENLPDNIRRIVMISDTHGQHGKLNLPPGDLLIHSGDLSGRGYPSEIRDFMDWIRVQPHPYKVIIAGNHDFMAEKDPEGFRNLVPEGVHYLNDSGVTLFGIRIWGSPISPWFYNWAFNRHRGEDIERHWALIPPETDILITHGPPLGILDRTQFSKENVGCESLLAKIREIRPKLHVFGHIHEAYGQRKVGDTLFVNASVLNVRYQYTQAPVTLDWPLEASGTL